MPPSGFGRARAASRRRDIAALGEDIAAGFLVRRGLTIERRNVRAGRGEVDLVASAGGMGIAVEVKTRWAAEPAFAFDDAKARLVRRSAGRLGLHRVDLITVTLDRAGAMVRWLPGVV